MGHLSPGTLKTILFLKLYIFADLEILHIFHMRRINVKRMGIIVNDHWDVFRLPTARKMLLLGYFPASNC